jgi:hypothetical protein
MKLNRPLSIVAGAALLSVAVSTTCQAAIVIFTGQSGAQVQDDIDHTQHWTFNVSSDVNDVVGGLFTMKRGPHTTENIEFDLYEGTFGNPLGANLISVILGPNAFTQSYTPVEFSGAPVTLLGGHTYTGVLWSNAIDSQSDAYFIKGGDLLSFTDENGLPVPAPAPLPGPNPNDGGGSGVPLPVGAPAAGIAIAAGAIFRAFRR